ncbi:MAG TPA: tetratricopeptide repeat protein, partial [Phycisphaerales bacterium]|nr:tetratricopeptide repeat protein [Phycisphaerales bacterium]
MSPAVTEQTDSGKSRARARRVLYSFLLVIATGFVFWGSTQNGFVWDDVQNLVRNEHERGFTTENVKWSWTHAHEGHYQPLTWMSYMLDFAAAGGTQPATVPDEQHAEIIDDFAPIPEKGSPGNARPYHVTNIVLHCVNAMWVYWIAITLLGMIGRRNGKWSESGWLVEFGAMVCAGMWALHPMRVESVAWITERRDVLACAFLFPAIICYLQAVRCGIAGHLHTLWKWAATVLFAISLLCKAIGMTIPVALLVADVWVLGRMADLHHVSEQLRRACRLLAEKWAFLVLAIGSAGVALWAQHEGGALARGMGHGFVQRLAQAGYGLCYYVISTVSGHWWPLHEIPVPLRPNEPRFVVTGIAAIVVTITLFLFRKRWSGLWAAWATYAVLVSPVLGLAQSGVQIVADRYMYLSGIPIAVLVGHAVGRATMFNARTKLAGAVVMMCLIGWWSWMSMDYVKAWRDESSIWTRVLEHQPSAMAQNQLGAVAKSHGDYEAALDRFKKSLEVAPTYNLARINLANVLDLHSAQLDRAMIDEAIASLKFALVYGGADAGDVWYALGSVAEKRRDINEMQACCEKAVEAFDKAGRRDDAVVRAWRSLGIIRRIKGDDA